jgi:nucleoside-diphosphate-sugar epimerase
VSPCALPPEVGAVVSMRQSPGFMLRVLIAGCGYVGSVLAGRLAADGCEVWGLRRKVGALPRGVRPLAADLTRAGALVDLPVGIDCAVYAVAAKAFDEAAYRATYLDGLGNLLRALSDMGERPRRIFFTSSTSVYGQRRGEWVDESSPTYPLGFSGEIMLLAERLLLGSPFPATVLRLGGIYGPGRARLIDRVRSGRASCRPGPPHYTNSIHRDDAAGALRHLMRLENPESLYLGVDCEPADERDVFGWLAETMMLPPPGSPAEGEAPPPRRAGSKRCRNARLLESGYRFRYPSFREGYGALLRRSSARPDDL